MAVLVVAALRFRWDIMKILGIESSCDETAAAIVEDGRTLLSSVIASQASLHSKFGGVVPEIASREHIKAITPTVKLALEQANLTMDEVDAITVTYGPGLIGALLVGVSYAKALAYASNKPLYAAHHIAGHISANFVAFPDLEPPFMCLVVSGGHSHIILVEDYVSYKIIGRTRDDATGEAFDKIARAIDLGYPGGPKIDKLAQSGNRDWLEFPKSKLSGNQLDFSFSGIKTAALNLINQLEMQAKRKGEDVWKKYSKADFCASIQGAVVDTLVEKTIIACEEYKLNRIVIAGGVAANSELRKRFSEECEKLNWEFYCPPLKYCTDNALMIASLGAFMIKSGFAPADINLDAKASLDIETFSKAKGVYDGKE